jgi:hypothetical protein
VYFLRDEKMIVLLDFKLPGSETILFSDNELVFSDKVGIQGVLVPGTFQPRPANTQGYRKRQSMPTADSAHGSPSRADPKGNYDETKSVRSAKRSLSIKFNNQRKSRDDGKSPNGYKPI